MCNPTDIERQNKGGDNAEAEKKIAFWKNLTMLFGFLTVGLLVGVIVTAVMNKEHREEANELKSKVSGSSTTEKIVEVYPTIRPPAGTNVCAAKNPGLENIECVVAGVVQAKEQAAVNVTKGYNGKLNTTAEPIKIPYWKQGLCPVNVHWHLGTEHYSAGEYDEEGTGPTDIHERRKLAGKAREGFQCRLFDAADAKFTTKFEWKHCVDMEVGQTYEVHWPHSAGGACGTLNQYQTPFYDGVFCNTLNDTAAQVGVQAQIFTIVNDEAYYYPDLMRGMIVEDNFGSDMAMYTGSTTSDTRNNTICSAYAPITWQVDRKCHMVSASSFDKMCADMKAQRDDMTDDLHPHGSRPLVADNLAANNQVRLRY
jgi:Delta carbonic anhydrase